MGLGLRLGRWRGYFWVFSGWVLIWQWMTKLMKIIVNLELTDPDFVALAIQYSSVIQPWSEWTSSQNCSNHLSIGGIVEIACIIMWQYPAQSQMGKMQNWGLNLQFCILVGYVYNRSGAWQAIPTTPGLPQCHTQMHKRRTNPQCHTKLPQCHTQIHTATCTSRLCTRCVQLFTSLCSIATMPSTNGFYTILHQKVAKCTSEQCQRSYTNTTAHRSHMNSANGSIVSCKLTIK